MAADLGAVAPGRKADLALLRASSVALRPLNDLSAALVYAETGASVETVLVDGRIVMERGVVLTVDEERLRDQAQNAADRLRHAGTAAWQLATELTPYVRAACRAAVAESFPVNRYATPI
jgi:cytosine/adenosine deaminase-related metal-dependent hydrolase